METTQTINPDHADHVGQTRPPVTAVAVRDPWVRFGLVCVFISAAILGFVAWTGLGELAGINQKMTMPGLNWTLRLSWLLQVAVEGYAVAAIRVWWADQTASLETKTYARRQAVGAVVVSFAGQSLYHVARQYHWTTGDWWWVAIVLVGGVPAVMIALSIDLQVRLQRDRQETNVAHAATGEARGDSGLIRTPGVTANESVTGRQPELSARQQTGAGVADLVSRREQSKSIAARKTSPSKPMDYGSVWAQMQTDYQTGDFTKRKLMERYGITNGAKAQELYTRLKAYQSTAQTTGADQTESADQTADQTTAGDTTQTAVNE